jgi:hypothetical protein
MNWSTSRRRRSRYDRESRNHHGRCGMRKAKPCDTTTARWQAPAENRGQINAANEHELFLTETFLPCRALPFVARWLFRSSPARSVSSKNRKQKIPEHATQPEHGLSSLCAQQRFSLLNRSSGLNPSKKQKRLSKENRSLRFAPCARRPASRSFFCLLDLSGFRSRARARSRGEEVVFQSYYLAKWSGDLLDRGSFQSNGSCPGLVPRRVQG